MAKDGKTSPEKAKADDEPAAKSPVENTGTAPADPTAEVPEVGGRDGPDPTRYGDWEINGRCVDF